VGLFRRVSGAVREKATGLLDRLEDPHEAFDRACVAQLARIDRLRRQVARIASAGRALSIQLAWLERCLPGPTGNAGGPSAGVPSAAGTVERTARRRHELAAAELAALESERAAVETDLQDAIDTVRGLEARLERLREDNCVGSAGGPGSGGPGSGGPGSGAVPPAGGARPGGVGAPAAGAAEQALAALAGELRTAASDLASLERRMSSTAKQAATMRNMLGAATRPTAGDPSDRIASELAAARAARQVEEELAAMKAADRQHDRAGRR
jgi:hypothetical protein